jgi:D-2-hydroxyacid dehydrogenase (NADP+)
MDSINVLLMVKLEPENLRQISAISPRLKILDASPFLNRPFSPRVFKDEASEAAVNKLLAQADIAFQFPHLSGLLTLAPKLKWIQLLSAGAEYVLTPEIVNSTIIITNTSGIHVIPISETVFSLILMFAKQAPRLLHNQEARKWESFVPDSLAGKTLGIIGYGSIGRGVAHLGRAFGMKLIATRRSSQAGSRARDLDQLYPPEALPQVLVQSDYVVIAVPSTTETRGLIGEKELRRMKPGAFLVNIARGNIIDESALVQALQEKRIAGAGLDTFTKEPLSPESPLWSLPNVFITPHISGVQVGQVGKALEIFLRNLERYVAGKKLINVVDKKKGY